MCIAENYSVVGSCTPIFRRLRRGRSRPQRPLFLIWHIDFYLFIGISSPWTRLRGGYILHAHAAKAPVRPRRCMKAIYQCAHNVQSGPAVSAGGRHWQAQCRLVPALCSQQTQDFDTSSPPATPRESFFWTSFVARK